LSFAIEEEASQHQAVAVYQQQQQQRLLLRLASFSTNVVDPKLLAVLPAHSLTQLDLDHQHCFRGRQQHSNLLGAALSAALSKLSNLQQLRLAYVTPDTCLGCCEAIPQLTRLTCLDLEGGWRDVKGSLQRLLAMDLPLQKLHVNIPNPPPLTLTHLTQLEMLTMHSVVNACGLPPQLQSLTMWHCTAGEQLVQMLMPLQNLQHISLQVGHGFTQGTSLVCLAGMSALKHLTLDYTSVTEAAAHAAHFGGSSEPVWARLPQLDALSVRFLSGAPSRQQMDSILAGVASCASLTKLRLEVNASAGRSLEDSGPIAACASLAGLTRLEDLCIAAESYIKPGDVQALTTLTNLTRLELGYVRGGVGDAAAAALAVHLRQLRELDLRWCDLGGLECLADVRRLTQLTALKLGGNSGLTAEGLMMLTGLRRLQQLGVTRSQQVTEEVVHKFWAVVCAGDRHRPVAASHLSCDPV
jgi:hypothetical protein